MSIVWNSSETELEWLVGIEGSIGVSWSELVLEMLDNFPLKMKFDIFVCFSRENGFSFILKKNSHAEHTNFER